MKIAMIGQKGIPALYGGVERHVEEISKQMARKKNCEVFVYVRPYYTPSTIKKYKGVNIVSIASVKTKHLDAISHTFLSTFHAIFVLKADVIHFHAIGPALCAWLPKILSPKTKVVFTFHCRDYFHQKWNIIARFLLKTGEWIGCHVADEIITVSSELKQYVENTYGRKAMFIPHGIYNEKQVQAKIIKKWGLKKNGYILIVSRLIRHKGIHYLIKAYQRIKTNKKLVIVGPSFHTEDYESELKKLAKGCPNILFLGAQRGKALKELYSNAYVFVSPSEYEGLPLVLMEAVSFGRPLLLSSIGPHKEIFGDLPHFFRVRSVGDLEKKLEWALKSPAVINGRARKLKRFGQEKYNWNKIANQTVLRYN